MIYPDRNHLKELASGLFLALASYLIHSSSFNAYWRADDGYHLLFALEHSPNEYLFSTRVMAAQSFANITPFNALFYDINLALFGGNDPTGHYVHLWVILSCTAVATYILLRRWVSPLVALFGATLYLIGSPTYYVGQYLMVGHYVYGLLFATLSLHAFLKGTAESKAGWIHWGAVLYGLAALSKEVYVPLVGLLPLLANGSSRQRITAVAPYAAVALAYFWLRTTVLGNIVGGYESYDVPLMARLLQIAKLPFLLVGNGPTGIAGAILIGGGLLLIGLRYPNRRLLLIAALVLLVAPLFPLTANPGITAPDRYLYFLWWGISIMMASALTQLQKERRLLWILPGGLFVAITMTQSLHYKAGLDRGGELNDLLYRTTLHSANSRILLLPPEGASYFQGMLNDVMAAHDKLLPASPFETRVLVDYDDPTLYPSIQSSQLLAYQHDCRCFRDISDQRQAISKQIQSLRNRYIAGHPLSVEVRYEDGLIHWNFSAVANSTLRLIDSAGRRYYLGNQGHSFWPPHRALRLRVEYLNQDGTRLTSPYLAIDPEHQARVAWQGSSVAPTELTAAEGKQATATTIATSIPGQTR